MLKVANLSVSVGNAPLVQDVSFELPDKQWLCVIGPNGAGKSSLLRAMCQLMTHQGSVTVCDVELSELDTRARARLIAYCPQDPLTPGYMTVREFVSLARSGRKSVDIELIDAALDQARVSHFVDRKLATLSGGERRRVAIAQALAQGTPILVLDEPTTSLDIGTQQEVLEMLRATGKTLLTTAHELTLAGLFADRLLMMSHSRLVAEGSPSEVLTEKNIAQHFGATVEVTDSTDGGIQIIPVRRKV